MSPVIAFDIAVVAQKVKVQCCYMMADMLDLELEQISCHIQVQSNVGMVDAGDLEPCIEYLVMIRWTLTTF